MCSCPFGYATPPLTIRVPCVARRPMGILRVVEGLAAPLDLVLNFSHFFVTHATHEYGPLLLGVFGGLGDCGWLGVGGGEVGSGFWVWA